MIPRMFRLARTMSWGRREPAVGELLGRLTRKRPRELRTWSYAVSTFLSSHPGVGAGEQSRRLFRPTLLPLRFLSSVPDSSEHIDEPEDWRDWFPWVKYGNPWDTGSIKQEGEDQSNPLPASFSCYKSIPPLLPIVASLSRSSSVANGPRNNIWLQAKQVIRSMQVLYHAGSPNETGRRPTVEGCNLLLARLLAVVQVNSKKAKGTVKGPNSRTLLHELQLEQLQCAVWADAILQTMTLFLPQSNSLSTSTNPVLDEMPSRDNLLGSVDDLSSPSYSRTLARAVTKNQRSRAHNRLPFEPPIPNRITYNTVLKILANTPTTSEPFSIKYNNNGDGNNTTATVVLSPEEQRCIPERAEKIVQSMEDRYNRYFIQRRYNKLDLSPPEEQRQQREMELKTHGFHLSCVLLAWEQQRDVWDKSVPAAKVFLEGCRNRTASESSFLTMLRICAHNHPNEESATLGANVAVKLWQEVIESPDETVKRSIDGMALPSHFYVFFLQAIRALPLVQRETYIDRCMTRAIQNGKVNEILVNEFLVKSGSKQLFHKYFNPFYQRAAATRGHNQPTLRDLPPQEASAILVQEYLPREWVAHADGRDWHLNESIQTS